MTTNVDFLPGSATNEALAAVNFSADDIALLESGNISAWWPGSTGLMEGVLDPDATSIIWKDYTNLKSLKPHPGLKDPIVGYDDVIKQSFLQFGYGGSGGAALSKGSLTLKHMGVVTGGSNYTAGDILTFSNGVEIAYRGTSGSFANAVGSFDIINYGTFTSKPTAPMSPSSSTGSGSGATFLPSFFTDCGSLEGSFPGVPGTGEFFVAVVAQMPLVADQPESGGWLLGGQLNHCPEVISTAGNARQWGFEIDSTGRLRWHFLGDQVRIDGIATDRRDNAWHLYMATGTPGTTSRSLWTDGQSGGTLVNSFSALSIVTGAQAIRVGACGLPDIGPTGGLCGRIGAIMFGTLDLTSNTAARQTIQNNLLSKFLPGVTSA